MNVYRVVPGGVITGSGAGVVTGNGAEFKLSRFWGLRTPFTKPEKEESGWSSNGMSAYTLEARSSTVKGTGSPSSSVSRTLKTERR